MILAFFQFSDAISWILGASDGSLFELPKTTEWLLVSPLLYPEVSTQNQDHFSAVANGKHFCRVSEIVLATKKQQPVQDFKSEERFEDLRELVRDLLLRLRHIAGQATIPKFESCFAYGLREVDDLPTLPGPEAQPSTSYFQRYLWTTAITAENIHAATSIGADFIPPAHEVLFLDAIVAHRESDYRSAILYAAISAEVVLGLVIDKEYDRVIAAGQDERFRVIERRRAGETSMFKDPIYERMRSRPDFNVLMHELPLYILRRSLLVEEETLYLKLKRLYLTRNKIAHSGGVAEAGSIDALALDEEGSNAALETAVALFSWLGQRADFCLPVPGFVSGN